MTFSISTLVSARDSHIKPDSEALREICFKGWYQERYGKFHVIIYLSHILHWVFSRIDFYIAYKIFELTNFENKSSGELPFSVWGTHFQSTMVRGKNDAFLCCVLQGYIVGPDMTESAYFWSVSGVVKVCHFYWLPSCNGRFYTSWQGVHLCIDLRGCAI